MNLAPSFPQLAGSFAWGFSAVKEPVAIGFQRDAEFEQGTKAALKALKALNCPESCLDLFKSQRRQKGSYRQWPKPYFGSISHSKGQAVALCGSSQGGSSQCKFSQCKFSQYESFDGTSPPSSELSSTTTHPSCGIDYEFLEGRPWSALACRLGCNDKENKAFLSSLFFQNTESEDTCSAFQVSLLEALFKGCAFRYPHLKTLSSLRYSLSLDSTGLSAHVRSCLFPGLVRARVVFSHAREYILTAAVLL